MKDRHQSNRHAWNEAAEYYRLHFEDSIEFLKNGGANFCKPELTFLKNLSNWCESAIHLQCAAGHDTLSLINLGAHKVVGVDISDEMISLAEKKSQQLKMNAEWLRADILDIPDSMNDSFDLVYTGRGALFWIMDLKKWAQTVSRLLKNGGYFYMFESHPISFLFSMESTKLEVDQTYLGYFSTKVYESQDWPAGYVGAIEKLRDGGSIKFERSWPISDTINALLSENLRLIRFEEHPDAYWSEFPKMSESERTKIPNTFSLFMQKQL